MTPALYLELPRLGALLHARERTAVFERGYMQIIEDHGDDVVLWGPETARCCAPEDDERFRTTLFVSERLYHLALRSARSEAAPAATLAHDAKADAPPTPAEAPAVEPAASPRGPYTSWAAVAALLGKDVRTLLAWRRKAHDQRKPRFADEQEVWEWARGLGDPPRKARRQSSSKKARAPGRSDRLG